MMHLPWGSFEHLPAEEQADRLGWFYDEQAREAKGGKRGTDRDGRRG